MEQQAAAKIGRTVADSEEYWPPGRLPPEGAPNVVVILLDDVGFAQLGCYGSDIDTPVIDRIAREGLRFTNFHSTPLCSPTRACLLTGRNQHSVGFGHIVERAAGFPGYNAQLPDSAATIAQTLRLAGYSTQALGKWHLTPSYETGPAGPFDRWPLGRGFERFYGFLSSGIDQFRPDLYRDNGPTTTPGTPEEGYHLTTDLVDEAISSLRNLRGVAPRKPFFVYLAPGACHTPHQAPRAWIDRYRGRFDHGWDEARRRTLERQKELGIMPSDAELGPSNPGVPSWDSLTTDQKRLYARMMEAYAGFLSHTDAEVGRLVDFLTELGELENTVVVLLSDNGASAEGGPEGSLDEGLYINDMPQRASDALEHLDELGGPNFYNHYPWGWAQAGNTPFRWYKQFTHGGGITTPCIVRYPAGIRSAGEVRDQFHHVIDIAPTILDLVGIDPPAEVNGVQQMPVHGVSMAYAFDAADAPTQRTSQYFETWGNRAFWRDGWMAISRLQPEPPGAWPAAPVEGDLDRLTWELYDHRTDRSECKDLASEHPEELRRLIDEWWAAAGKYQVLPVDTRSRSERWSKQPLPAGADPDRWVFHGPCGPYPRGIGPAIAGRSFHITAEVSVPAAGAEGVLYALGGVHGGYSWHLLDGQLVFEVNLMNVDRATVAGRLVLEPGRHTVDLDVQVDPTLAGRITLAADGVVIANGAVDRLLKVPPIGSGQTNVGFDTAPAVSESYHAPFGFTGDLHRLTVTTDGQSRTTADDEARADLRAQ